MGTIRGLLSQGNGKVGESVHLWGLPAGETCPGMSEACGRVCYARQGRFRTQVVSGRLAWNLQQSRRAGLRGPDARPGGPSARGVWSSGCTPRATSTTPSTPGSGEWVMRGGAPRARFYFYTRSWRVEDHRPRARADGGAGETSGAWYSADADTGPPPERPAGRPGRLPPRPARARDEAGADLVFRVRGLRQGRVGLGLVCPSETPQGKAQDVTCGSCQRCWE